MMILAIGTLLISTFYFSVMMILMFIIITCINLMMILCACFAILFGKAPVSDSTLAVKPSQVTLKLQTSYLFYYFFLQHLVPSNTLLICLFFLLLLECNFIEIFLSFYFILLSPVEQCRTQQVLLNVCGMNKGSYRGRWNCVLSTLHAECMLQCSRFWT